MFKPSASARALIIILALFTLFALWLNALPVKFPAPSQKALISWPAVLLTLVLATLGYLLSQRIGNPKLLDKRFSNKERFLFPALFGGALAVILIILDLVFRLPADINVTFPYSMIFYFQGAVFTDIQHFFPIVFLVWLIANLILKGRFQEKIFWSVAVLISLIEPIQMIRVSSAQVQITSLVFPALLGLYIFAVNLSQAYFLRRYGLLAMFSVRWGQYFIWHILWGMLRLPVLYS